MKVAYPTAPTYFIQAEASLRRRVHVRVCVGMKPAAVEQHYSVQSLSPWPVLSFLGRMSDVVKSRPAELLRYNA